MLMKWFRLLGSVKRALSSAISIVSILVRLKPKKKDTKEKNKS